jgi:hypothetical protein
VVKLAQFARGQFEHDIFALLAHDSSRASCAVNQLSSLAGLKLDIMYQSPHRNGSQRQGVAESYVHILACLYSITQLYAQRSEYVALFSVSIMNEGDTSRPVRVIFNGSYFSGDGDLVPPEVQEAKLALASATSVTHCQNASAITSSLLL